MKRRRPYEAQLAAEAGVAANGLCACGYPASLARKTLCRACYERRRRANPPRRLSLEEKFFERIQPTADPMGCWLWVGSLCAGYGRFGLGKAGANEEAHRWSYEFLRAEIPDGLVIDHLCRQPRCVNPWHLEPVTRKVNALRGEAPMIVAARMGFCQRGHSLADALVLRSGPQKGRRNCRTCVYAAAARRRAAAETTAGVLIHRDGVCLRVGRDCGA